MDDPSRALLVAGGVLPVLTVLGVATAATVGSVSPLTALLALSILTAAVAVLLTMGFNDAPQTIAAAGHLGLPTDAAREHGDSARAQPLAVLVLAYATVTTVLCWLALAAGAIV